MSWLVLIRSTSFNSFCKIKGNLKLFRKWEDGIKQNSPTIYNERRIYKMSTKKWKNKELSNLMTEKFGFKMDLNKLNEQKEEQLEETEELDENMNEQDADPKAIASRIVADMDRPEKADQSKNPHLYHSYYLLKQLSLDGDVNAAKAYFNNIKSQDPTSATRMLSILGQVLGDLIKEELDEGSCSESEIEEGSCKPGPHEGMDEGKDQDCPECKEAK